MSEVVLKLSPTPEVRDMAQSTITKQGEEVATLTTLIKRGPAVPSSLDPYRPANMVMHDAMMAAKGDNVSETYLRKMLEHHRGAIGLADVVLGKGAKGAVRSAALKVKTDQTSEAAMISGMLAGEPMAAMPTKSKAAASPAVAPAVRSSSAAKRPAPSPAAVAKPATAPTATPSPAPTHDMKDMPGMKM